jgi:MinD superfamily P-loop ATPase
MDNNNLNIAVLSGKGGTGKTFVSVNLASSLKKSIYVDCDVEEPNGRLFFDSEVARKEDVNVKMPTINNELCSGCRKCVEFCKFNAMAFILDRVKIFDSICHSCGGCSLVCPESAIIEEDKSIGHIEIGESDNVTVYTGILNIGEASGVPIINKLLGTVQNKVSSKVFDCPPGSSCLVMESIKDADYCVLVAEPTIFGMHNFEMVYDLVKLFNKPFGVVINKYFEEENMIEKFCVENNIKVLERIPFNKYLASMLSKSKIAVNEDENYKLMFESIIESIKREVTS